MADFVEAVDALLVATKRIVGQPAWQAGPRDGQQRWLAALDIEGVVSDLTLIVDAYPRESNLKFTISLICGSAITRLDYSAIDRHNNHQIVGIQTPDTVEIGWIIGPHYHGWAENRRTVKAAPPKELEFAIPLPSNVQGFENCFRWFCAENRIDISGMALPVLPARDILV